MNRRGAIYHEEAYAQGKMLNHDSWCEFLPRNITPSDIDMCFDNRDWLLVCELSSKSSEWKDIQKGQRLLYESLTSRSRVFAALLKHSVKNRKIDTLKDIEFFQVMISSGRTTCVFEGERFRKFVESFYRNPEGLHNNLVERMSGIDW